MELESRESSSPHITRAVAAALQGRAMDVYEFPAWQKLALRLLGRLPQAAGRWLVPRVQPSSAVDSREVQDLSVEDLAATRLRDYAALPGPFPRLTMGVGMGGATAHLAALLGGPYLPQAFVLTLKNGSMDGDVTRYFRLSADLARRLADSNPNLLTIQHYDPVHDGWLTRRVNHLRLKLLDLPEVYKRYIRERLEPGGEVIYLEGGAQWLRYRTGPRSVFQVGGWGDISAQEFLEGSQRLGDYCRREGLRCCDWRLTGYEPESGPESEWGSEPELGDALEVFCQREGFRLLRIAMSDPNGFSRLAFRAYRFLLEKEGRAPAGVVVETFSQYDATAVLQCGLMPLWLIFNTADSLRFLQEMVPEFPREGPVFFSPLATFSLTPDIVPFEAWQHALAGFDWTNTGARASHYPADSRAVVDWAAPLRAWCAAHPNPIRTRITGEELMRLAS